MSGRLRTLIAAFGTFLVLIFAGCENPVSGGKSSTSDQSANNTSLTAATATPSVTATPSATGGSSGISWQSLDIGSASGTTSGTASLTIGGKGKFESSAQTFRYVYTTVSGDFTMTARLDSYTGASSNQGWAGLLFTPVTPATGLTGTTLTFGASVKRGDNSYNYGYRLASGDNLTKNTLGAPSGSGGTIYLKLSRTGNAYGASYSLDGGTSWGTATTASFTSLPTVVSVGFAVNSGSSSASATAVFSDIKIVDGSGTVIGDGGASATPTPTPTATPVGQTPTPSPTPSPTPVATPSPTPSPTPDPSVIVSQGAVNVTSYGGWFETGYAVWNSMNGVDNFNVYVKESSAADSSYVAIDASLVRGTRVDLPGLAAGTNYSLKIAPVAANVEYSAQATVVSLTPVAYDRSGFAFLPGSTNGDSNGAYNANGTLKSGALVLYITDATKNTVQMAVTKGSTTTTYTGLANIMKARESAKTTTPLAVRFIGTVNPPTGDAYGSGLLDIKGSASGGIPNGHSNVTLEGIGTDAQLYGWGLNIRAAKNIEVRNLSFYMFPDDSVSIQTDNRNVWVHNNDFFIGANGGGDKALGDGSCDIKDNSSYVTVSYNHFHGTGKSSLCGLSESSEFFVTYHHNYFNESHSRHPRVRTGTIHVYNNYFKGQTTYAVGAAEASSVFVQNNYFENVVRPMMIASQGHDYKDLVPAGNTPGAHESIMSGEAGGSIKASGNYMDTISASWFDASVDTGNGSGGTYNNFDGNFASNGYSYQLDSADDGKTKTVQYAGRIH